MDTVYDYIGALSPFILIVVYYLCRWLRKLYKWVSFKNKYPILSDTPPNQVLSAGDIVIFNRTGKRYEFRGVSNTDGLFYVFIPEDNIDHILLTESELLERLDAVYGQYGLKWKKVN